MSVVYPLALKEKNKTTQEAFNTKNAKQILLKGPSCIWQRKRKGHHPWWSPNAQRKTWWSHRFLDDIQAASYRCNLRKAGGVSMFIPLFTIEVQDGIPQKFCFQLFFAIEKVWAHRSERGFDVRSWVLLGYSTIKTHWKQWILLVVSTPLKKSRQIGSSPQVGVTIRNIWNHHLGIELRRFGFLRMIYPVWNCIT